MADAGRIIPIHKGDWTIHGTYEVLDQVYYAGSTYIAKNNIADSTIAPGTDTTNWVLSARGFESDTLTGITGTDSGGLLGTPGVTVGAQVLIDEISSQLLKVKYKSFITPEDFGAVGNETVDDTVAVQNAINEATTKKMPLLLSKRYVVSSLTVNQCIIVGHGGHTGFIGNSDTNYTITLMDNGAVLRDFSVYANYGIKFGTYNDRVLSNRCEGISVVNCFCGFYHPTTGGYNYIINSSVYGIKENGRGIVIGPDPGDDLGGRTVGTNYFYIINTNIGSGTRFSTTTKGIVINSCEYLAIQNCDIVGFSVGIETPTTHGLISNIKVFFTQIFSCLQSIKIQRSAQPLFNIIFDSVDFSLNIGIITSIVESKELRNITFTNCHYVTTGESITEPTLTLFWVDIDELDISGESDGCFLKNVIATGSEIKKYQSCATDVYILQGNSATLTYGKLKTLEPIKKPYVVNYPQTNIPVYTRTKDENGIWTLTFTSVAFTVNGEII